MKNKIESFAASQEDFPTLLFKAKKYLIARGKLDWSDTPSVVPALRRSETLGEAGAGARGSNAHAEGPIATAGGQHGGLGLHRCRGCTGAGGCPGPAWGRGAAAVAVVQGAGGCVGHFTGAAPHAGLGAASPWVPERRG